MTDIKWVGLEVGNNWNHIYYTYEGESLHHGMCNTKKALRLQAGQIVTVRFPDGTVRQAKLSSKRNSVTTYDMGHSYSTTQVRYGFEHVSNGLPVWVPIEDVQVPFGSLQRIQTQETK